MIDEALFLDPALARFYDIQNPWRQDFTYCKAAAKGAQRILDIGCGTGMLAVDLAQFSKVTGLDPAQAMLDIAAARPGGDHVTWICGDARRLDLNDSFDLILMTGHAFQTLLTDDDQARALTAIARHLAPNGRFIFDSRNPEARAWEGWQKRGLVTFEDPQLGTVEQRSTYEMAEEVVTYTDTFRILRTGAEHHSRCRIRFRSKGGIDAALSAAGLATRPCFGDWSGAALTPSHPEFVYDIGHA